MALRWPLALLCACVAALAARAAPAHDALAVKALLAERCTACHGALKQESDLRVDTTASMIAGGASGPAVVAGDAPGSLLLERISAEGDDRMPPPDGGAALSAEEIATIRGWIEAGAPAPADDSPESDPGDHWAFKPPVRPPLPTPANPQWTRNAIDVFIDATRASHGLTPQREADKRTLLRRVYLDLVGLPPSRAELAAFEADAAPDAYERVVDRLLASPPLRRALGPALDGRVAIQRLVGPGRGAAQ